MTTEFNTLFETVTSIAEQVDPIKLNQTLAATAEALTGLGDRFGRVAASTATGFWTNSTRACRRSATTIQLLADLADVYADASPDLWDGLENAVITARTFNDQRGDIDAALMAAIGFADDAADELRTRRAVSGTRRRATCCRRRSCSTTTGA